MNRHSKKLLSTKASTRATAYAMSNKIISARGKIFVAWLDYVADIRIATYDTAADTWTDPILLGKGEDNHSGPAITMDSQGYLYAVFGPHHGPFQFRRSTKPYDATAWEPEERFALKATYPSLVCDADDTLHLTYRGDDGSDVGSKGGWWLIYQRRKKGGTWSRPQALLKPQKPYKYTQFGNALAVSKEGTLHLGFHVYAGDPLDTKGTHLGYLCSRDGGESWESAQGLAIALPASRNSDCFIEQGPDLDMRIGDLVLDGSGRPWLTAMHLEKRPHRVLLWSLEEKSWQSIDLLDFVTKTFPGYGLCQGTMTFDREGQLYVVGSVNSNEAKSSFGDPSQEIVLLTSRNRGRSFEVLPVSTPDPKVPNWLPSIERPFGPAPIGAPSFLFTSGNKGEFGKNKEGGATKVFFVSRGPK